MSGGGAELAARAAEALVCLSALTTNPAAGGGQGEPEQRQEWSAALDSSLTSMKGIIYGEKDAVADPVAAQQLREALLDVRALLPFVSLV